MQLVPIVSMLLYVLVPRQTADATGMYEGPAVH